MFGKPISKATKVDLDRLIRDKEPEGRHLEFKSDFPGDPSGAAWTPGKPVPAKRIQPLLEELVAFANADGGVIVLGMHETNEKPARASHLAPLPQIAELERRVRDSSNDLIDPRLPFVNVVGMVTEEDGSGVLLLETYPSSLGPNWVRPTRGVKVRREDRADPLSMPEIHDMVLRNARRFDEVKEKLLESQREFEPNFFSTLDAMRWTTASVAGLDTPKERVLAKLKHAPRSLVGIRVTIVPHQKFGLSRLEDISQLVPSGEIGGFKDGKSCSTYSFLFDYALRQRRIIGGIVISRNSNTHVATLKMDRDGFIEVMHIMHEDSGQELPISSLFAVAGSALGCYRLLRRFAN